MSFRRQGTVTAWLWGHLRCPDCYNPGIYREDDLAICPNCLSRYDVVTEIPVLLRSDNHVFSKLAFKGQKSGFSTVRRGKMVDAIGRIFPRISVNLSSRRCLDLFAKHLETQSESYVLVVGCGTQRKWLDERFNGYPSIKLIYCDIDKTSLVDCFCDAHDLPFVDACFDGVITTAVLQHVLYPERAASEICRLLKPSGMLYSEMAFMQQVIEGAYDFTRYSHSGHRRLFNHFQEIESGMVAGPATALVWSIENFVLAFFRNVTVRMIVKSIVRLMLFWIKYFDYMLEKSPQALDGASCTFFLGSKRLEKLEDSEIINRYTGAKHLEHV